MTFDRERSYFSNAQRFAENNDWSPVIFFSGKIKCHISDFVFAGRSVVSEIKKDNGPPPSLQYFLEENTDVTPDNLTKKQTETYLPAGRTNAICLNYDQVRFLGISTRKQPLLTRASWNGLYIKANWNTPLIGKIPITIESLHTCCGTSEEKYLLRFQRILAQFWRTP